MSSLGLPAWASFSWWHGVLSTITSTYTIIYGLDPTFSAAISVAYFILDEIMAIMGWTALPAAAADHIHHFIGISAGGTALLVSSAYGDMLPLYYFVCLQMNELSTIFMYPFLHGGQDLRVGLLFALTFFLSRILQNITWTLPNMYADYSNGGINEVWIVFASSYQLLQCFWFYKIIQKVQRKLKRATKKVQAHSHSHGGQTCHGH